MEKPAFDLDWLIIGSGFGGSVSALRLAEKGYKVAVLEAGRRFEDEELPKSSWSLRRFLWVPRLGLQGILRVTPLRDAFVLSGAGVGGGSLVYAATLYRAPTSFFEHPQWQGLRDWEREIQPHYDTAERYLGAQDVPFESQSDRWLQAMGTALGCAHTFKRTRVGIYFGVPGTTVPDPIFNGEGPARTGCTRCSSCMLGCPVGAKNTLVRNYLYLAEKRGVDIMPLRTVVDIRPIGAADGSEGYLVTHERSGAWLRKDRRQLRVRGVVVAAGALGSNELLLRCKHAGSLPALSPRLGELVRTNSENGVAVTLPGDTQLGDTVSITGSIFPDADSHIEAVALGPKMDLFAYNYGPLLGPGNRLTQPLKGLALALLHPLRTLAHVLWPFGWGKRTLLVGIMQTADNAIQLVGKRRWLGGGIVVNSRPDPQRPLPKRYALVDQLSKWLGKQPGAVVRSGMNEILFNTPFTAHIMGGLVIGRDREQGVVNTRHEVFGYCGLLVCDGSVLPANPGVNPSLTITALTELAMTHIPRKETR